MAGGKLTPRQKMINMMYLVLTAMLALNVSAEILDAFTKIDVGLVKTAEISTDKNNNSIESLQKAMEENAEKTKPWYDRAVLVREKTKETYDYIQQLKLELVRKVEGSETDAIQNDLIMSDKIKALDNISKGDEYLVGVNRDGVAYDLQKKLKDHKEFLIKLVQESKAIGSERLIEEINAILSFEINKKAASDGRDWEAFTFQSNPMIASLAIMSKQQVDVLNCETSILEVLKNNIGATDYKIKEIGVAVNNPSAVLIRGAQSEAEIFLAAYDPTIKPVAIVGGSTYSAGSDGKIKIKYSGSSLGPQTIKGRVEFTGPDGRKSAGFEIPYYVVEPALVVSPTKMNVFYLGVDNPVDLSVSGVTNIDRVNISVENGAYNASTKSIRPTAVGRCVVRASYDGNSWSKEFRVKRVPDPRPAVHGISGKSVNKGELVASQGVVAIMPADFDFDLRFTVTSFIASTVEGGFIKEERANGQMFTAQQKTMFQNVRSGSTVFITDIKAQGPDGVRDLSDLVLKVR